LNEVQNTLRKTAKDKWKRRIYAYPEMSNLGIYIG
jgi:hypothetical protein